MEAYAEVDRTYARSLNFDRVDGSGARLFSYPTRFDKSGGGNQTDQQYFYRAMTRQEAFGWMAVLRNPNRDVPSPSVNGHQGWASHRAYSLGYMGGKSDQTYLLEVFAPEFLTGMKEIGFTQGKAEKGDISWGIGPANSNGFGADTTDSKKARAEALKSAIRETHFGGGSPESSNARNQAKLLAPWVFKHSIRYIKVVNLRSRPI